MKPAGGRIVASVVASIAAPGTGVAALQVERAAGEGAGPPATVGLGEVVAGSLDPKGPRIPGRGPSIAFEFAPGDATPVAVALDSFDFDAWLRVEDEATARVVAEMDDGGVATNAALSFTHRAGGRYRIVVAASSEGSGEYELSVTPASEAAKRPPASGFEAVLFREEAAARAIERGDLAAAKEHRFREGGLRLERRETAKAREAYRAAIDLARATGDRWTESRALGDLGVSFERDGDVPRAREAYEAHLALATEIGDEAGGLLAVANLGVMSLRIGDHEAVRRYGEDHLARARRLGDRAEEAAARRHLAEACIGSADFEGARTHLEEALGIARERGDPDAESTATLGLCRVARATGDLAAATRHGEASLALARRIGNRDLESSSLNELGLVAYRRGDFPAARTHLVDCLEIEKKLGDGRRAMTFEGNLGVVEWASGDFVEARERFERQVAMSREFGDRATEAAATGNLGLVFDSLGLFEEALDAHRRRLGIARELGDRLGEANALGNLGLAYLAHREFAEAKGFLERQLALAREIGDRFGEANALGNLSIVDLAGGDPAASERRAEEQRAVAVELGDRRAEASALASRAAAREASGDPEAAREAALQSIRVFEAVGSREEILGPLLVVAHAALDEGDAAAAREALARAESGIDRPSLRRLGIAEASTRRSRVADWSEVAQDLAAIEIGRAAGAERTAALSAGFADAGRWKGAALLAGIAEHRTGGRTREAVEIRRRRLEAVAARDRALERVAEAVREKRPTAEVDAARVEAATLGEQAAALAASLAAASPADAALDRPSGVAPEAVRSAALGPGTALVEYAEGRSRLYAYVVAATGERFLDLGERELVERAVSTYFSIVSDPARSASAAEIAEKGRGLFEVLLGPAIEAAGVVPLRGLVVVPTPRLSHLPFEALVLPRSGALAPGSVDACEFVLDRYEVTYAPSSPVLVELAARARRPSRGRALLLGDPLVGDESAPGSASMDRLRGTREEVRNVAREWSTPGDREFDEGWANLGDRRSGELETRELALRLGGDVGAHCLRGDLRSFGVLHLATHGIVDSERPERSGLVLAAAATPSETPPSAGEGFVGLADVLDLDLDADLVVLSACRTAAGAVRAGEGVESLARAFLYAGARGVVASLWDVSDSAAAETMALFYRAWLREGASASEALRRAKRELRGAAGTPDLRGVASVRPAAPTTGAPARHPFDWAPFVLVGLPSR